MPISPRQTLPASLDDDGRDAALFTLTYGYQVSQIVATFARLDLADHLEAGARSGADLARATGADPSALRRFVRATASIGLVEQVDPDRFGLTRLGAGLCTKAGTPSVRDLVLGLTVPALYRSYEQLFEAVMTGRTVARAVLGAEVYRHFEAHPDEARRFAGAMSALSTMTAASIVPHLGTVGDERIVDVGGSHGAVLIGLLEAAPRATGVLFDLPRVIAEARQTIAAHGLADRVECVAGDFFESVPEGGDVYILSEILHNWEDERAARILENCRRAARPGSRLLVIEMVATDDPDDSVASMVDLVMLAVLGGRERTRREHERLLDDAGYRLDRVVTLPSFDAPRHLLEATRW